jgi:putative ABC transport system ATP-binding protein
MGEVEVHALRGIDLDLYEGEFVVLLGAPPAAANLPC